MREMLLVSALLVAACSTTTTNGTKTTTVNTAEAVTDVQAIASSFSAAFKAMPAGTQPPADVLTALADIQTVASAVQSSQTLTFTNVQSIEADVNAVAAAATLIPVPQVQVAAAAATVLLPVLEAAVNTVQSQTSGS